MTDWNLLQRFADIGASKFKRHWLYEDLRQEILFDLWRKVDADPNIDRPLLVWYARSQAYRHFNKLVGDPRSKWGRRQLAKDTGSYDGNVDLQERVAGLGAADPDPISVSQQYGLDGREAVVADLLSQGVLKSDIAELLGTSRTIITRVCKKLAERVEAA